MTDETRRDARAVIAEACGMRRSEAERDLTDARADRILAALAAADIRPAGPGEYILTEDEMWSLIARLERCEPPSPNDGVELLLGKINAAARTPAPEGGTDG